MRSVHRTLLAALAFAFVLHSEQAAALEVFGNAGLINSGVIMSGPAPIPPDDPPIVLSIGQGFTTGTTAYDLQAVRLGFRFNSANQSPSITTYLQIGLYTNSGGAPGTQVVSFSSTPNESLVFTQEKMYTFNVSASQTLAANTSYWIVVSSNRGISTNSFIWGYASGGQTDTPTGQNGSGYTNFGSATTQFKDLNNSGVTSGWKNGTSFFGGASIGVIVVPEPSTYALGIIGTLVMGAVARRKSRKPVSA